MIETRVLQPDTPGWLEAVVGVLRRGGLVAFPTDTVYGVGTSAFDGPAIKRVFVAKGRREDNPIPVLVAGLKEVDRVARGMSPAARRLAEIFWPGALTIVVARKAELPNAIGPGTTVGLRAPDHPVALAILSAAGPLAVTSANRSGEAPPTRPADVLASLGGRIEILVDAGEAPGGVSSTVVDCTQAEPVILREGPIGLQAISRAWERA